jgi:uncharacterized repeat protein (TIGR01451 family)
MTMMKSAVSLLTAGVLAAAFTTTVDAATLVLDPGPGTDYLGIWCGGQKVSEVATGFDAAANATTLVQVSTTCHGSGRGSPNQYYLACWTVNFAPDGGIASKEWLATNHWVQGHPAIPCPVTADPAAVYTHTDGMGNFPEALSSAPIGTTNPVYRAVLETTCAPVHLGDTVSGTISAPGEEACYSLTGSAGDGVRVGTVATGGVLMPVSEMRRPDGTVLCGPAAGTVDCTLDASGLHTIVVQDAGGAASGSYDLSLACLGHTCGNDVPHVTIAMTGTITPGRFLQTVAYAITVGNDGGAPSEDLVLEDTLPKGLFVRSLSSTQGTCSHVGRAVTCAVGSVAVGESVVVNVTALILQSPDSITNTACVETDNCVTTVTDLP